MAFVRLKNGKGIVVSAEQGVAMWRILANEIKGRKKQRAFVARIRKIYLNRDNAPQSYLDAYPFDPRDAGKQPKPRQLELQARLPYAD